MDVPKTNFKLCTFNLENPYDQIIRNDCKQYNCPREKQFQPLKFCEHKHLDPNQIENKKKELWGKKFKQIISLIKHSHLIALQELEDSFVKNLKEKCKNIKIYPEEGGYDYVCKKKPYSVLLCDTQKWKVIKSWTYESTPIMDLCDIATNKTIRVASVHFTGYDIEKKSDSKVGDEELKMLMQEINKDGMKDISGCLIMGDFNAPPESIRCKMLRETYSFQQLSIDHSLPKHTHTNIYSGKKNILDYIFFKDLTLVCRKKDLPKEILFEGEDRVSDHIPVYGILTLNKL